MIGGCDFLIPIASGLSCAEQRPRAVCQRSCSGASGPVAPPPPPVRREILKARPARADSGPWSYCLWPWLSPFKILLASGLQHCGRYKSVHTYLTSHLEASRVPTLPGLLMMQSLNTANTHLHVESSEWLRLEDSIPFLLMPRAAWLWSVQGSWPISLFREPIYTSSLPCCKCTEITLWKSTFLCLSLSSIIPGPASLSLLHILSSH